MDRDLHPSDQIIHAVISAFGLKSSQVTNDKKTDMPTFLRYITE